VIVLLVGLLVLGGATEGKARVVLVGVDGGSWNVIDPLLEKGELPHLEGLRDRGVTADLETVEPVNSPTVWTSIATWRFFNDTATTEIYTTRLSIQVPTTWERMAGLGLRVGLYDYLVTWPPADLPGGFVIPGWIRRDEAVTPPGVFERAGVDRYVYSADGRSPDEYVALTRREVAEKPGRFVRLADAFELDVAAISFYAMDVTSHRFWHAAFPEEYPDGAPPSEPRHRTVIHDTLRGVDRAIGEIAAELEADDTIVVVSDHGFEADTEGLRRIWSIDADALFAAGDLVPERDAFTIVSGWGRITVRVHPGAFEEQEAVLERVVAFLESVRTGGGEPLFTAEIVDIAARPPEATRSLRARVRQWVVGLYLWWYSVRLPKAAHSYVFALPREEPFEAIYPGGTVVVSGNRMSPDDLFAPNDFSGTHDPVGIFLAAGGPVMHDPERGRLSVLDVSPLLFYLAGSAVPDDLDGHVPEGWIEPAHLASRPPTHAPAARFAGVAARPAPGEEGTDEHLLERLRSLGYVE
jgi:predicted AlkP superfamily phosphohydrolase/phosphomutase